MLYQATHRGKDGRLLHSEIGSTPEIAAASLFAKHCTCMTAQICGAYWDQTQNRYRGNGMNVHWLDRARVIGNHSV